MKWAKGKHSQIDFETLTALAVARSLWIILQVVSPSLSLFRSLLLFPSHITVFTRLSHCARCFNLISCSPRTLFCFWCQLRSYFPLAPFPLYATGFALPASHCDWLLSLMEDSVCQPSSLPPLSLARTVRARIVSQSQFSNCRKTCPVHPS